MSNLWGGRFGSAPADALWRFTASSRTDRRLLADDCAVLRDHIDRLATAGLLTHAEQRVADAVLDELSVAAPDAIVTDADEDVHSAVERILAERLPEIAPKTRAGLSRNDRVASALRRYLRRETSLVAHALLDLIDVLAALATEHRAALMPGYTHLQRAQPITLGHHLLAHAWAFTRDAERMRDALGRMRAEPLGAGALAGSTLALPAVSDPVPNSLDAVAARDHVAELLAAFAICGVHASRLGEEFVLWTSTEFGFAELDDAWATGSSLMPQKKNPDVAELARAKAGRLIGDLTALLVTLKGLPLAYDRDLQEDKEPVFDALDTLSAMLPALTGMVETARFDVSKLAAAAADPMLLATDLAELLVQHGVPFRVAHDRVGAAVRAAITLREVSTTSSQGDAIVAALSDLAPADTLRSALDPVASVAARTGSGPGSARTQLDTLRSELSTLRASFPF